MKLLVLVIYLLFEFTSGQWQGSSDAVFAFPNTTDPVPFEISVDPEFVHKTITKVRQFRPTKGKYATWTNEGPDHNTIADLISYWAQEYNWTRVQSEINGNWSHYAVTVTGSRNYKHPVPLHFIHERSAQANATPLLLLHGWPSTSLEWRNVIGPLTAPNDTESPAFHVVAPDLPGFGFSPAPEYPNMGIREMGAAFNALMEKLNYTRYGLVTTDIGWLVGSWMDQDLTTIRAHFSDFFLILPDTTDEERFANNQTTEGEAAYIASTNTFATNHFAYSTVQAQKPLAIGLALNDSPVGFAGWVWDLIYTISDGYQYTLSEIVTDAMALFVSGVYNNIRAYEEAFTTPGIFPAPPTSVRTGASVWGSSNGPYPELKSAGMVPRSWIERSFNVTFYASHDGGGHFPAISRTDEWLADVRDFFLDNP